MEFAFLLTVKIGVTDASQDAAQLAAQLGNTPNADFIVLQLVEKDLGPPIDKAKIESVEFIHTNSSGTANSGEDLWKRTGSTTKTINNVSVTIPWTQNQFGYLDSTRCNQLSCGVDYIGVTITYQYTWITPLPKLAPLGPGPKLVQNSLARMEPVQ
jgi:hypothetical protein